MSFFITLVAADAGALAPKHIAAAAEYLEGHLGGPIGRPHMLAPGMACDIPFPSRPALTHIRAVHDMMDAERVDVFVTAAADRRKKLLLADMESTIITGEMLDELAQETGPEMRGKVAA